MKKQKQTKPVGAAQLQYARETLLRYQTGRAELERRLTDNERWWKERHRSGDNLKTKSQWLVNVVLSKHADAVDGYPEAKLLPRTEDDVGEARTLSKILPCILEQSDFFRVWSENWWRKLKSGTAVYGVFWDAAAENGLGGAAVTRVDPLKLYWDPEVPELQQSRDVFLAELWDTDTLKERCPGFTEQKTELLSGQRPGKTAVIDWYYKRRGLLHYCKFAGDTVLFATENEPEYAKTGLYRHGLYPFVTDVLFPAEGSAAGWGYLDLCRDAQRQIDRLNDALLSNCLAVATPRYLVRGDGGIHEEEFADWTRPFVHVQGSLDEQQLRPVPTAPLTNVCTDYLEQKITELKETAGNRDVNNGDTSAGVTAAAAITAMQEQSGKLSRDQLQNSYRCFRQVVYLLIELIRQFYDAPREFRVAGEEGISFLRYDNRRLKEGSAVFDIEVRAEKQTPVSRESANELALKLFEAGFFAPENTARAAACLELMDFRGREQLLRSLRTEQPRE